MKLSQLINYRNQLDALTSKPIKRSCNSELEKITYIVENHFMQFSNLTTVLKQNQQQINESFDQFEKNFEILKQELNDAISTVEKHWFVQSYELYNDSENEHVTSEYILNRRLALDSDTEKILRARIGNFSSWQHPAMIIRPGLEDFVDNMVSFDPLYLVDTRYDLLTPAAKRFNEQYQARLRLYTVQESQDQEILTKLPNGQFGVCLAYNFFNYKPFEVLKKYLNEIYQKLKPGGILAMTFNDCDNWRAVDLVERHFCCYTPGYLVKELLQSIGFELVFSYNNDSNSTWIEVKKPGTLTSLRGGQALAKVIPK